MLETVQADSAVAQGAHEARTERQSPQGAQRRGIQRFALRAQTYVFACAMHAVSVWLGLCPAWQMWVIALYCLTGQAVIHALLRSPVSTRFRDPELTLPQVLFGISAIGLAYAVSPLTRNAGLLFLFLLFVFDLQKLGSRQINLVAGGAFALLMAILAGTWWFAPDRVAVRGDLLHVALSAALLPILAGVGKLVRARRKKLAHQKAELAATLQRLEQLSRHDALTGLFNRRQGLVLLDDEVKRHKRTGRDFAVAILDIDWFKRINDSFGHAIGDAVLRDFSRLIQQTLDGASSAARWGGEEFLVIFPEASLDTCTAALARLRTQVAQHDWSAHASGLQVSFSAGATCYVSGESINHTLDRADQALYRAKAEGRDRTLAG